MPSNQDLIDEYVEVLDSDAIEKFCPIIKDNCQGLHCMMFRVTSEVKLTTEGKTTRHPYGVCGLSFNPYANLPEKEQDA